MLKNTFGRNTINDWMALLSTTKIVVISKMENERSSPRFNIHQLTHILDGGKQKTLLRHKAELLISRDNILNDADSYCEYNFLEKRERTMMKIRRAIKIRNELLKHGDEEMLDAFDHVMVYFDRNYSMRYYVHELLFKKTIWAQGTPEQFKKYERDIQTMKIIGCFAMTELGHSSYLPAIETTAVYDRERKEFIINSPTLTSTKWWIGMAGETATHTVALCRLIIDNTPKDLNWFIIPLRDPKTGKHLPGVSAGITGPKMGRDGVDNGWIQFSHVRIPLENLLMRYAKVLEDGTYIPPANRVLSYFPLIGERITLISDSNISVSQCLTIAIRYAVNRLQGVNNEKIMDYLSHQDLLIPHLATCFASNFVFKTLIEGWNEKSEQITNSSIDASQILKITQDYHSMSSGLKAWLTWWGADALEACRRSMGGHAYSSYNAISDHINDFGVLTTGGGDNIVLVQQNAQYLLNTLRKITTGKSLPSDCLISYFSNAPSILLALTTHRCRATTSDHFLDITHQLNIFQWMAIVSVIHAGSKLKALLSKFSPLEAWNQNMLEIINCSKLNSIYSILEIFNHNIDKLTKTAPEDLIAVLVRLRNMFFIHQVKQNLHFFLQNQYMCPKQVQVIEELYVKLLKDLRKDVIPLVDAFDYPDWILRAPVASKHGNIYEKYFERVKRSSFIAQNGGGAAPPYWEREISPLTNPENASGALTSKM